VYWKVTKVPFVFNKFLVLDKIVFETLFGKLAKGRPETIWSI
jgi:hypothetical protein